VISGKRVVIKQTEVKMTKIVKINAQKNQKVSRESIAKFGDMIYSAGGVRAVRIGVAFSDGTAICFRRCEIEDDFDILMEGD